MMYVKHFVTCKACAHVWVTVLIMVIISLREEGLLKGSPWDQWGGGGACQGRAGPGTSEAPSGAVVRSTGWLDRALDPQGNLGARECLSFYPFWSGAPQAEAPCSSGLGLSRDRECQLSPSLLSTSIHPVPTACCFLCRVSSLWARGSSSGAAQTQVTTSAAPHLHPAIL